MDKSRYYKDSVEFDAHSEWEQVSMDMRLKKRKLKELEYQIGLERIEELNLKNKALAETRKFNRDSLKDLIIENDYRKINIIKDALNYFAEERYFTKKDKTLLEYAKEAASSKVGLQFPVNWFMDDLYFPIHYPNVIGARPGVGKTTTSLFLIYNFLKSGKRCLYYSIEATQGDIICRLAAMNHFYETGQSLGMPEIKLKVINGEQSIKDYLESIENQLSVIDANEWTASKLVANVNYQRDNCKRMGEPEFDSIIIDYLQDLESEEYTKQHSSVERLNVTVKIIRSACKKSGASWILLGQLNRNADNRNRKPIISELKGSGAIEQAAGQIILLHQEEDENGRKMPVINVNVAKNRYGPVKNKDLHIDQKTGAYIGLKQELYTFSGGKK